MFELVRFRDNLEWNNALRDICKILMEETF
jgi:hypothetical protein